ncbi:hypothetical protein APHAL10511_006839 [Amanita phalloides]|nr:hypothetical protein APHAL10511_006839 [Amanita phalloides]
MLEASPVTVTVTHLVSTFAQGILILQSTLFVMLIKTLTGKEIELDIDSSDKITRIKEKVEEQSGVPPQQQRLIFGGRQMPDERMVSEFNISAGAVLHLVLALRGGQ